MMEGWKEYRIKDLGRVVTGKTPPTKITEYFGEGYPFITPTDLVYDNYYINYTERQVTELAKSKFKNYFLPPNSISYTCIGATVGKSCLNREYVLTNQQINSIIPNEKHDAHFIYYYLNIITPSIVAIAGGAATPIINKSSFEGFKIFAPPLPTQRKIAKILSAYDDLIENNRKRIKLLEEMAQKTYEEWFVRLKFPGHETVKFDKEKGLPDGWKRVKLGEVCELVMGQSPKSEFYNTEKKGLPFHQGVKDYGDRYPTNTMWSTKGNRFAEKGTVLFSVRAPVGRLNIALERIIIGRGLASVSYKNNWNGFLYYQLKQIFFEDNLMGGGAIFNSVTKNDMLRIELIEGNKQIMEKFNIMVQPIDANIENLHIQNQHLKEARDILLPRLMTGVINV